MREDVKKYLFIGPEEDKEQFFQQAQKEGIIHFIDPSPGPHQEIPEDVQRVSAAIKVLRGLPPQEQEENFKILQVDQIVNTILNLHARNEQLLEEQRVLTLEIARIEPFGDFSFSDIDYIQKEGKCKIRFFVARPTVFQDESEPEDVIFIKSEHGLNYYVAINDHPVAYEKMIEMKFDHSLGNLKRSYKNAQAEHRHVDHELKEYAKYNEFLHHSLIEKLNRYHLYNAQTYVQQALGGSLFAVEEWVPVNKVALLKEIIGQLNIFEEEIAIEPTDVVPTYLENHGAARLGEDLVHVYDTPSHTDKDPSMWVLVCFTLFFAFIIGDAGYGLVYLALALFLRYKFPNLKGVGKRVLNLFTILCVGCVIWGTLMTSFLGCKLL